MARADQAGFGVMLPSFDPFRTGPPPLVRGEDLIALGLKPGPKFGEILEAVETRQLEGALKNRDEALDWVKTEFLPTNDAN